MQVRRNVWLELLPRRGAANTSSWKRLLPKTGFIIGTANCIMNEGYIDSLLPPVQPPPTENRRSAVGKPDKDKPNRGLVAARISHQEAENTEEEEADPYAAMMMKINMDIGSSGDQQEGGRDLLLSRTFKGLVAEEQVDLEPGSETELSLFVVDEPDKGVTGGEFPVRTLLRRPVEVTANEDFRYFNNCYQIEPQAGIRSRILQVWVGKRISGLEAVLRTKVKNAECWAGLRSRPCLAGPFFFPRTATASLAVSAPDAK